MIEGMLTTGKVARRYGVERRTVRRWCEAGRFAGAVRIGTSNRATWIIPESDLLDFIRPRAGRKAKGDNNE